MIRKTIPLMTIALFLVFSMPFVQADESYCINDDELVIRKIKLMNITENGNSTILDLSSEDTTFCEFGCSNNSWSQLGYAGCRESPIQIVLVGIVIIILFILLMRFLL